VAGSKRAGLIGPARLTSAHDTTRFDCERPALNDWLKNRALESEGPTARTYVVCDDVVVGYYCIATGSVERKSLPSKMKRVQGQPNQIPVAIIGRLTRDKNYKGLGKDLLKDALERILHASETIGIRAVLVHAIDDEAAKFWREQEFIVCPDEPRTFFLAIDTIADAIGG